MNTDAIYSLLTSSNLGTEVAQAVQQFLGTKDDPRWAMAVYRIVLSDPHVSLLLDENETKNLRGKLPTELKTDGEYKLKAIRGNYLSTKPATVEFDSWPYNSFITLYYAQPTLSQLSYGGKTIMTTCRAEGNILDIDWPDDTGLVGAVECPSPPQQGMTIAIQALLQYPVDTVIRAAKNTPSVTALLEHQNLVDEFYFGDSPEEKLAVLVLALYKEVYHV